MFLGLCILADWIGSNEECSFPSPAIQPDSNYIDRVARQQAQTAIAAIGCWIWT